MEERREYCVQPQWNSWIERTRTSNRKAGKEVLAMFLESQTSQALIGIQEQLASEVLEAVPAQVTGFVGVGSRGPEQRAATRLCRGGAGKPIATQRQSILDNNLIKWPTRHICGGC